MRANHPLREIIYLDRGRVESYISQLEGTLRVTESSTETISAKTTGGGELNLQIAKAGTSNEDASSTARTISAIPAHAILSRLEMLLNESGILQDIAPAAPIPGELLHVTGADISFESWGLLADLAETVQGVAGFANKIWGRDLTDQQTQFAAAKKRLAKGAQDLSELDALKKSLAWKEALKTVAEGEFVDDIKTIVRLFFQQQNHIRINSTGHTFVGLLRKEHLVGSTIEELLFDYGARPQGSFGALFYVSEMGRQEAFQLNVQQFTADIKSTIEEHSPSVELVQAIIRLVGTLILGAAEELRRPIGEGATFVIPLALYRTIRRAGDARA